MDLNSLNQSINEYKNITIFRHKSPDGDAVFSQCALKQFFKDNFPNKKIMICGNEVFDLYPEKEDVSNEFIENSLAIVLDTANADRVDDERYKTADLTIKIDHHPPHDQFCDFNFVNDKSASCCEVIAEILFSDTFSNFKISKKTAKLLYLGMLTDTLNFRTVSTSANTLFYAYKLASMGININDLSEFVLNKPISDFEKISLLRTKFKVEDNFGYCFFEQDDLNEIKMTCQESKNAIAEFGNINELNVWCIISYNKQLDFYEASIRSKKAYSINQIAEKFGGGGHSNASGIKGLSKNDALKLLEELKNKANS